MLSDLTKEFLDQFPLVVQAEASLVFAYDTTHPDSDGKVERMCKAIFPKDFIGIVQVIYAKNSPNWIIYREDFLVPFGEPGRNHVAMVSARADAKTNILASDLCALLSSRRFGDFVTKTIQAGIEHDDKVMDLRSNGSEELQRKMLTVAERVDALRAMAGLGKFKLT